MGKITYCQRCGDPCQSNPSKNPKARPFKRASHGLCAPCVVCKLFQEDGENGLRHALPLDFDPEGLRLPHIQEQFARVLAIGGSELAMDQIDWEEVIQKWRVGELSI